MKHKLLCVLSVAAIWGTATQVHACYYHALLGMSEPKGIWPQDAKSAVKQIQAQDSAEDAAISNAIAAPLGAPLAGGPSSTRMSRAGSSTPTAPPAKAPTPRSTTR